MDACLTFNPHELLNIFPLIILSFTKLLLLILMDRDQVLINGMIFLVIRRELAICSNGNLLWINESIGKPKQIHFWLRFILDIHHIGGRIVVLTAQAEYLSVHP